MSPDVDPVLFVLDLHMEYTVEVDPPCRYIVWVCYCVITDRGYVRSVGHVFAYLYTFDDDLECPIEY